MRKPHMNNARDWIFSRKNKAIARLTIPSARTPNPWNSQPAFSLQSPSRSPLPLIEPRPLTEILDDIGLDCALYHGKKTLTIDIIPPANAKICALLKPFLVPMSAFYAVII
jgi:hypothetical protein